MNDGCGRSIDHLRLSLTDHCNLACKYCVGDRPVLRGQMIDEDFAFQVVRWLSMQHGIRFVRLTGGEPLLYPKLIPLIKRLAKLDTLEQISLTTNGQTLSHQADALRIAGLSRVNISLDTLKEDRFAQITRGGKIRFTLRGIEEAIQSGLTPVKINVVVQRSFNDDEIANIAEWGLSQNCIVRFLEVMPIGPLAHVANQHLVPASEILERLSERFTLRTILGSLGQPATDYAVTGNGLRGVIGIIAPTTRPFCDRCRRIRLTAKGQLYPCLLDSHSVDLYTAWSRGMLNSKSTHDLLRDAIERKPEQGSVQNISMISLGG